MNKPHHRKQALRQAFISTVATAAAVAATGCLSVTSNPPYLDPCPEAEPASGDACDNEGLSCGYVDDCTNPIDYGCEDGAWTITAVSSCNPPPPGECPLATPTYGAPCDEVGLSCTFGEDPCGTPITGTCSTDGWQIDEVFSCNPPPAACPAELPAIGTLCEPDPESGFYPEYCGYDAETPCGIEPVIASCLYDQLSGDMVWQFESAPTCEVPPEQCQTYGSSSTCDADPGCSWRVPGCSASTNAPSLTEAGCFPAADCSVDGCGSWGTCTLVTHDPCWNALCDACGAEANVCIPNE